MKRQVLFLLAAFLAVFANPVFAQEADAQKSYDLKLNYSNRVLSLSEVGLKDFPPVNQIVPDGSGWHSRILTIDGDLIHAFDFAIPAIACHDQPDAASSTLAGCAGQDTADFVLNVPYYKNGASIEIRSPGGEQSFTVDTARFADLCGDNICEAGENHTVCGQDCRSGVKDGTCDGVKDGTCDFDCAAKSDSDCFTKDMFTVAYWAAALLLAAVAGLSGFMIYKRRKSGAGEEIN